MKPMSTGNVPLRSGAVVVLLWPPRRGARSYDDFDEAEESFEHVPVVEDGVECVGLVAMQGQLQAGMVRSSASAVRAVLMRIRWRGPSMH